MTIGGTDGDVIVNDAAGESVTITKWTSRRVLASDLAASAASVAPLPPVITETTTAANQLAADAGIYPRWPNASAKALTVRPDSTETLPVNGEWHVRTVGAAALKD